VRPVAMRPSALALAGLLAWSGGGADPAPAQEPARPARAKRAAPRKTRARKK